MSANLMPQAIFPTLSSRSYIKGLRFAQGRMRRMSSGRALAPMPIPLDDPTGVHCFARLS